jgi:tetratricopeptide (TPR) repeat protein
LQDNVAKAIANEVKTTLTPQEETRLSGARQVDPVAHQAYLRGLYELHGTTDEAKEKAISYFQEAVAHDPNDALAYAGLASAYSGLGGHYQAPTDVMPKARAAAVKAVQLDDTVAEAHASLGFINLVFDWNWPGAEREFRRALELNPNSAAVHTQYAEYLLLVPHSVDEGVREVRRAYDLDPLVPQGQGDLVWFLFESRRYSEAIEEAAKELRDDSPFLSLSYAELGQRDRALAVADRAAKNATAPIRMAQIASAYALAGNTTRAHEILSTIIKRAGQRYVCGVNMGAVYSVLGEKDQAFAWLEKGYRDRST